MYVPRFQLGFVSSKPRSIKGGCVGMGILQCLLPSIWVTSSIDGLKEMEACVQRSPTWRTYEASSAGISPFKHLSIDSIELPAV